MLPSETFRARRMAASPAILRLHLGSGPSYKPGWVNVDLARPGRPVDLCWDLRRGLPFPEDSVDAVFSEHLWEHLRLSQGLSLMKECARVLRTGHTFRIGVPDLRLYVHAYGGTHNVIDDVRPGLPTHGIALNELFYQHGHRAMYDEETLGLLILEAGFRSVVKCSFGEGVLGDADTPSRRLETLYMEAIK
jgi:predicted SAM-dependent methyltransferase